MDRPPPRDFHRIEEIMRKAFRELPDQEPETVHRVCERAIDAVFDVIESWVPKPKPDMTGPHWVDEFID